VFASATDVGRIDALLKRACKSFSKDIVTFDEFLKSPAAHHLKDN